MVASTDIKFYVHTNNNAPQLQNAFGSMINVLDACLINGINVGTVSSLSASGSAATALFSSAHNLKQGQVVRINGANQAEFNGEHRVLTVPNSNTVTFELASTSNTTTATGTINASLPPLGWEKPFSSVGKAAYRSTNSLLPTRPFLRIVDEMDSAWTSTYAKYAKVGIVEEMTDIDTMFGVQAPFDSAIPDKNWTGSGSGSSAYNGWAKWIYALGSHEDTSSTKSATPPNGSRSWVLVGNSDCFYIFNRFHTDTSYEHRLFPYFFGAIDSDYSKVFALAAVFDYSTASTNVLPYASTAVSISDLPNSLIFQRNHKLDAIPTFGVTKSLAGSNIRSGYSNYIVAPDSIVPVFSYSVPIYEGNIPRGVLPLVEWLQQVMPYSHLTFFKEGQNHKIAVNCMAYESGQLLFNLGN